MTLGDLIAFALVLLMFGGSSGLFTFASTQLILNKLKQMGFFIQASDLSTPKPQVETVVKNQ